MKIKLEVSELVASCLQRMIVYEIDNQKRWHQQDLKDDMGLIVTDQTEHRTRIIQDMTKLADDLEKQGIPKYIKCY